VQSVVVEQFLTEFKKRSKLFYPKVRENFDNNRDEFIDLGEKMLDWAYKYLGDDVWQRSIVGYSRFVTDVNRSQMKYEKTKRYENSSYEEVYKNVYNNSDFMESYHWGVYLTTFAWEHHLELHRFFKDNFLKLLDDRELRGVDLGAGSGIWSMLLVDHNKKWKTTAVDISEKSVDLARNFVKANQFSNSINVTLGNALTYEADYLSDFGVSCFLIEHLEDPSLLFNNLFRNLKEGAFAFVTAALTAAEIDHIYEIKNESELINMAEKAGFRVLSSFSAAPRGLSRELQFLPRSMGMVLQKRRNSIW
jgi:ubiquinone/menaquinone biosynthesis C-methylase UbiE